MSLNLLEMFTESADAIKLIDKKLDSLDGGTASLRSTIIDEKIESTKDNWSKVSESIVSQLAEAPTEVQIGFFYGLARDLNKAYGDIAKKFVDELVATMPKPEPLISQDEVPALTEQRKELYTQVKAIMNMAEAFGDDDFANMENPRRRGGAPKGKRGPRALSFFTWSIDDVTFESLKDVTEAVPQYTKVAELRAAMKEAGFNLTTPPAEINFTLPDGKVLVGINGAPTPDNGEDDEDEDEEVADDEVTK